MKTIVLSNGSFPKTGKGGTSRGEDFYQAASLNEGVSHSAKFKTDAFNSIFVSWISTKKDNLV